jgi:(+)-abscisic acid 8'-hydroxylase
MGLLGPLLGSNFPFTPNHFSNNYNAKLKKVVLRAFTPEAIKNMIPNIESIAKDSLQSFEGRLINTFQEMKIVSY